MLQVVSQAVAKRVVERRIKKELISKIGKKNLRKELSSAFNTAFKEIKKTNPEIKDVFDLEIAIKKNKKLRTKFFTLLGEELQKRGLRGDKTILGKIGYKNIIRYKKAEEYRRILAGNMLGGIDKATENNIMKLQNLFDRLTKKFGTDTFTFYYKYNTDTGFRKLVNIHLMKEIQSDPDLSKLPIAKMKPEEIVHSLAGIRATFMTRRDMARFVARQLIKRAPIEFLKTSAVTVGSAFMYMASMPTMVVMQSVPQLSGMAFMTMYGAQHVSALYAQTYLSSAKLAGSASPHLLMKYAGVEQLRQQMAEAGRAGLMM